MLRTDGNFKIYKIEHEWQDNGNWVASIENEHYFSASKPCWQKTGIHGTFDVDEAKSIFKEISSKPDNNRRFRLVCVSIQQSREVIED